MSNDTSLELTRVFAASPERVFDAWVTEEDVKQWSAPGDMTVPHVEFDATVGGAFRIVMKGEDGEHTAVGTFKEIDRPNKLVYTWDWEAGNMVDGHGDETLVTITFEAVEEGTKLTLRHEGFADANQVELHTQGWVGCLNNLQQHLVA